MTVKPTLESDQYENGNPCHTVTWEDARGQYHEANFTHRADAEWFVTMQHRWPQP